MIYQLSRKESIFSKVQYILRKTDRDEDYLDGTLTLFRRVNKDAFNLEDPDDDDYIDFPILEGITDFKFQFYYKEKDKWLREWDSNDNDFKDIFPDVIKLDLKVKGPKRLSFTGIYQFRLEVPYEEELHPSL